MNVSTLYPAQCTLGESPLWHAARKSCFWTDIHTGILYEYDWHNGQVIERAIAEHLSLILEGHDDHLLLAVKGGIMKLDLLTGQQTWLTDLDKHIGTNRCNDGACDAQGRLWIGTMDIDCAADAGSLYQVQQDLSVKKMIDRLTIPNGLVWSAAKDRMYFIDTPSQNVFSYFFDVHTGDIQLEKIAVTIPAEMGMPDGMTIDAEGMLWIALYNGARVSRWNPVTGELLDTIALPALNITSCAFAGENLDCLVITSARENLSPDQLLEHPESGNLFIARHLPYRGLPNTRVDLAGW